MWLLSGRVTHAPGSPTGEPSGCSTPSRPAAAILLPPTPQSVPPLPRLAAVGGPPPRPRPLLVLLSRQRLQLRPRLQLRLQLGLQLRAAAGLRPDRQAGR